MTLDEVITSLKFNNKHIAEQLKEGVNINE